MNRITTAIVMATATGALLVVISPRVSGVGVPDACPAGLPGPELVFVPAGAGAYCIDSREVKQKDYIAFLEAVKVEAPLQIAACEWNDRFEPTPVSVTECATSLPPGSCLAGTFDPATRGEYSMTCVDWCDARAYCQWAGKRLCGGLGDLEETVETQRDPAVSEWQYACTSGGLFPYPYGAKYVNGKCIDKAIAVTDSRAGSRGSGECKGVVPPFDKLFDLAGSVREWTASCDEGQDTCSAQGGYYRDTDVSCTKSSQAHVRNTSATVGFRCCADAIKVGQ